MLLKFLVSFVTILTQLLFWAIFISVILSWFSTSRTRLGIMLDQIVRPVFRLFSWARIGMFDFSPILALIVLDFVRGALIKILYTLFS